MTHLQHIIFCSLLFLLFCLTLPASGIDVEDELYSQGGSDSLVIQITSEDFQSLLGEHEVLLVEFYAPWCGHCQNFAPIYNNIATELTEKVVVGKVNAIEEIALAEEFNIQAYPSLFLVKNNEVVQYDGEFSFEEVVSWVLRKLGPQITTLKTADEALAFLQNPPLIIAAVVKDNEGHKALHSLDSSFIKDLEVGEIDDPEVQEKLSLKPNEIRLISRDSEPIVGSLESLVTANDISRWLIWNRYPLLSGLDQELFDQLVRSDVVFGIVFLPDAITEAWLKTAGEIAEQLKNSVKLTWVSNDQFNRFLLQLGGTGNFVPTIIAFPADKNKRPLAWNEDQELTIDSAVSWLRGVVAGTSVGFRKSEQIPAENPGPVIQVVGKTFENIVLDPTKDVLLEIYANWCGHCKHLEPLYEKLATVLKPVESLVIAKIDGDVNGLPDDVLYEGFPTIYFFPAHSKEPILYNGIRRISSFVQFIKDNSKNQINVNIPESILQEEEEEAENLADEEGYLNDENAPQMFQDVEFEASMKDEL